MGLLITDAAVFYIIVTDSASIMTDYEFTTTAVGANALISIDSNIPPK